MANVLPREKRLAVTAALVDGNSIRAVERMTGVHRDTIMRFGLTLGEGCDRLHNRLVRDLSCSLVDMDEQWGWVRKKGPRVTADDPPGISEQWTWVALDRSSRPAITYHLGCRDQVSANAFMADLRAHLVVMPQLMTSDGLALYAPSIAEHMGPAATYAQQIKNYSRGVRRSPDHKYEPPRMGEGSFITTKAVMGAPNLALASTSKVEVNNLLARHKNGRMRRLCLAFSKTVQGHRAAVSLCYVHFNFCHLLRDNTHDARACGRRDGSPVGSGSIHGGGADRGALRPPGCGAAHRPESRRVLPASSVTYVKRFEPAGNAARPACANRAASSSDAKKMCR